MNDKNLQLKVGLVVFCAIAVLIGFIFLMGDFHLGRRYKIYADYKFSGAVTSGAPVKISGIVIGRVDSIEFMGAQVKSQKIPTDTIKERIQTRLTLLIDKDKKEAIVEGSEFFIGTAGILGEQFIEIVPGDRWGSPILENSIVRGVDSARTDLLFARMNTVLEAFSRLLSENKNLFEDLARGISGLSTTVDSLLKEKHNEIGQGIDHFVLLSKELSQISHKFNEGLGSPDEVKKLLSDVKALLKDTRVLVPQLSNDVEKTLKQTDKLMASMNSLITDDQQKLKNTIKNIEKASEQAVVITDDVKNVTKKLHRSEGTIGALLSDEDIYDDIKEMIRDLKKHPWKIIWRD